MAITAQLEDGRLLEFPDGTDPSIVQSTVKRLLSESATPAAPAEGIGAALKGGFKRFGSGLETALESIIDPQQAAERGLERGQKISEQYAPGASLERVKQRYEKDGLFSAAKEAVGQIPAALAEQAPNMAAALGGARLGAMAGAPIGGPVGALVGGGVGALAAALPQLYASNLERQAQEGKPVERSTALGAAVPAAALEVASQYIPLGRGLIGKILGPTAEKALARGSNEAIEQAAKETLTGSVIRGVGTGLLTEIPTEVSQQMLERLQAGLPLTTPDALAEYGEAAYGAGLVGGPFGGVARLAGRPGAREQYERLQQEQAIEEQPEALPELPSNITELPEGYSVAKEEIGKDYIPSFNIMVPGVEDPLATVDTEEEAQNRLQRYTEIRQQEREKYADELEKIDEGVQKVQTKLDYMEATQQTGSEEYQQLKTNFPTYMEDAAQKKTDLMDKIEAFGQPLQIIPAGQTEQIQEQFNVRDKSGETIQSFKTMGEAEAYVRDTVGEQPFKAAQQRTQDMKALEESLTQTMRGFGLKDVAFKLVDQIERNAAGAYGNKLIRVAMDDANPLQTMRHESVHALKELGFFTPQQWKALESRAKSEWIKTHLEGSQTEVDGQQMSRLEGYKKIGLTEDAIVEEAIADAFAAYDKGQTPPPGLIAQLFKRIKEFFSRLKQGMNGAGFQTADDIFQSIERGELKPGLKPTAKAGEIKFSQAPAGIPQNLWDLHNKSMEADEAASSYNVGSRKATATKASRRLLKAVADYVGDDDQAQIALMVKMNQESNRRNEGYYGTTRFSLSGAGVPLSTRNTMEMKTPVAQQDLGLNTIAVRNRFNNVREIAKALNQYTLDQYGQMNPKDLSPENATQIAEAIADEVAYQIGTQAKTGTGLGWYSNNYPNAVKKLSARFPELAENRHARSVFSALVAVTSNGEKVTKNIDNATKLYAKLRQGQSLVAMSNRRASALKNNLVQIQQLLDKHGENFEKVLLEEITVKEMNAALRSQGDKADGSYLANTTVPAAAIYFGPKLGAFYANLSGSEGYLTMDLWWTRSLNRMRGVLMPSATESSISKFRDMMDMPNATRDEVIKATIPFRDKYEEYGWNSELEHVVGRKEPTTKAQKPAWFKQAEQKAGDAFDQLLFEHSLEKMANNIHKAEFEMLEEAPFSATDRKFMYDAARKAQALLRKQDIDLSLADIQAALWYYEKRLYAKLSGKEANDIGYEEAIIAQAGQGGRRAGPSVVFSQRLDGGAKPAGTSGKAGPVRAVPAEDQKFSLKGVMAEVAPNPDHVAADKWREMTPKERLDATRSVANKVMNPIFDELGLRGFTYTFSTGKYEGEINPNIIINAPENATVEQLDEVARVAGFVLDQKSMVTFDEGNTTSGSQSGFVKVVIPPEMSQEQVDSLREHIANKVPEASGDSLRNDALLFGNFSDLSDKQYQQSIIDAIESFDYDGTIRVSDPQRFHSDLVEPSSRDDYLKGTRYGKGRDVQGEAGADVRREGRGRLEAIAEQAISLRDRWIDSRGAARLGGRERSNAQDFGKPTAEYGTPVKGAVSAVGVHFSKQERPVLSSAFFGSGLRGLENKRLEDNPDLRQRLYFYIDKGQGIRPEAGVGGVPHVIKLNNLYDADTDPSGILKNNRGATIEERTNSLERKIKDAGFDGLLVRDNLQTQGYAILYGKHDISTQKYSLKTSFATPEAAERAAYKKAPPSTPEFKRFLGASKIIDEGRAQVMYHASPNEFETFSEFKPIFVSPSADKAQSFSALKRLGKGAKRDYIYPLWVRAETPFDYEDSDHVQTVVLYLQQNNTGGPEVANRIKMGTLGPKKVEEVVKELQMGKWTVIESAPVQEALKSLGFDSFYVQEGNAKNLAVFKANQVKSITGNIGDFSLETKDMRYSLKKVRYSDERFKKLWDQSYYTQNDAENKTKGYLAFVNPLEFVNATASPEMYETLLKEKEPLDAERLKAYDQVPHLTVSEKNGDWKITGHEGRHRMLALHDAGYREVPVYIYLKADDAKSIPAKALTAEHADTISSFLMVAEVEPLSYANKDKAMSKFTRMESKVKYSLPNLSAAENDAVNRTTTVRESKGYMERILDAVSPKNYSYFRQAALNRYEALSVADKIYAKQMGSPGLRASQSAEAAAHMSDLHAGVAASVFGVQGRRGGVPVFKNGVTTVDHSKKGLVEILSPLSKFGDPRAYRDFQFYSGVKRGARLMAQGPQGYTEKLFEPADIKLAESIRLKYEAAGIDFEAVRKNWVTFNDSVTDYLVDTGVLSKIDAQKFKKYADYVPFYRQLEGEKTLGPNIFQSLSGVSKPKALGKGGEAPLADFMETIVRNTHAAITAGMKNAAEQKIINVGKQVGIINDIAPGSTVRAEERVKVLIDGVKHEYQCTDQMFADATRSLNMPDLPFISFLSAPADLLRNMITREPGFIMTNLLRDSVSAYVTSGVNITPISGTIVNFGKALKGNSPEFEAMMDAGIIGGYEFSANAEQSGAKLTADLMKKSGKGSVAKKAFDSVWDGLEKATTASDAATRMAVYERVLAETGDETEALYRALEVMNFNRKGSSAVVRILTAAVPFLNARMQGLDVFYRAITGKMNNANAKEIQEKFFRRGMMILGLSTMYYFAVAGNPDYEKQEQETKDNNWLIPGSNIRIPIPFEVGILFKTIPERIMAYTFGNDTGKDFLDAMKRAGNGFIPISPAAYIPQTFKPIIEAMTNYSFFTQREIVGMGLKDVAPEYQVGPGTSALGEFVGKTLGLSPIKVDYVFKGYTGTMGMYAVDLMDMVMDINSDSPKPTKRFEQLPIIKRLVLDPEARGNVTNYYQLKDSVDTTVRTMNLLEKSGKPEEFAEYVRENAGTLAMRSYVNDLEKTMKELRDMKGAVRNSTMSGDQKRDTITAIGQAENNLTTNIQTVKQIIEKAKP